ncbi:MAG: sulfite exporter TauE/SafE family protein, partial [Anaerolineae bacterium]
MTFTLSIAFFLIAVLYASVGSGGGSGYLAAMSLAGITPDIMRPTALGLNVLITSISTWKFYRAGHFSGRIFWPIAAVSIPLAFLGGRVDLPEAVYRPVVGVILLYSAWRLIRSAAMSGERPLPISLALLAGAVIGFVSGLVGIGGGIFLSPLLLLTGWANTRKALGITA